MENRLSSSIIEDSLYHFELHNLDYTRELDASEFTKKGEYRLLEDGFVDLPSQIEIEDVTIDFERAVTGDHTKFRTKLEHKTYSFEEIAEELYRRLQNIDQESAEAPDLEDRTQYTKKFTRERCIEIVGASAHRAKIKSGRITEENRQKILQALGPLRRKSAKRVVYKLSPNALLSISTKERQTLNASAAEIRRGDKTVFYTPEYEAMVFDEQRDFFDAVQDADGDYVAGRELIENTHDFKTPSAMTIADAKPERKFVRFLCERDNAQVIDCWLKNAPQRFYSIEYAWKKGNTPKRGEFSPDFFIKKGNRILVIEIKDDTEIDETSPENVKKFEYSRNHFDRLNEWLGRKGIEMIYQFNFLTPKSFTTFFQLLRDGQIEGFRSDMDVALARLAKERE